MTNALLAIIAGACLVIAARPRRGEYIAIDDAAFLLAGVALVAVGFFITIGLAGMDLLARFR